MAIRNQNSATSSTTARTDRYTVVGVYHSHTEAKKAVRDLKAAGYTDEQIGEWWRSARGAERILF